MFKISGPCAEQILRPLPANFQVSGFQNDCRHLHEVLSLLHLMGLPDVSRRRPQRTPERPPWLSPREYWKLAFGWSKFVGSTVKMCAMDSPSSDPVCGYSMIAPGG